MQLKVVKADGSEEEYLHTKVVGTVSNALSGISAADMRTAEHLTEVVTYFLYHERAVGLVTTGEIFSIIQAVLTAAGYEQAASVLSEYHYRRKLKRCRIEVVSVDVQELADAEMLCVGAESPGRSRWDKSRIVKDLVSKYDVGHQTARAIASMVEEKIFSMGLWLVPASLVKQLVLGDAAAVLRAERQLQTV